MYIFVHIKRQKKQKGENVKCKTNKNTLESRLFRFFEWSKLQNHVNKIDGSLASLRWCLDQGIRITISIHIFWECDA